MRNSLVLCGLLAACAGAPVTPLGPPAPAPVVVVAAAPTDGAIVDELAEPNRNLTDGEIALLSPIFRNGIDYAHVRVINNSFPLQPANVYMTPRGHVYAPGDLWRSDFSTERSATFVHEMTHVWQFANGMDLIGAGVMIFTRYHGAYEMAYPYELAAGRDLVDYGMEQQASIIEDYFRITVRGLSPVQMTNTGISRTQRDELYAAVMKNFFGNPRYARALDPAAVAERHAQSSETEKPGSPAASHGDPHMCGWRFTPRTKQK